MELVRQLLTEYWIYNEDIIFFYPSDCYKFGSVVSNVDKDAGKQLLVYVAGKSVNWNSHFGRQFGSGY